MPYLNAELTSVVIFDEVLYRPGGMVHRWMSGMTEKFEQHAKRYAPERTGELRAGIRSTAQPVGPRQMRGLIASEAPYSLHVIKGTGVGGPGGPIYATKYYQNPGGAYVTLWGSIDPVTGKFTTKSLKGVPRTQERVRVKGYSMAFGIGTRSHDQSAPKVITHVVKGQMPNNFLFKAWRATARNHSSIRGIAPFGGE